ncbi:DUF6834 family protein [Geoglobus sp.]
MDDIREVVKLVSERLAEKEVTTVEEIKRTALRAMLQHFGARPVSNAEEIVSAVVDSLCNEPLSLHSLHYSEELKIEDLTFRHIHTCKPTKEMVEAAYDEFLNSKRLLESIPVMKEVTDRFFSGYSAEDGLLRVYSKGKNRYGVYYSLIDDVGEDIDTHIHIAKEFDGEYVVIVPTEDEITHFLRFFARHSEKVKNAGFKIWVVNVKEKTIDPFIGYPKDFLLLKGFKNPKIATQINSLWRVHVNELD